MITYQGSIIYSDGFFVEPPVPHPDPYNPLNLPNNTIRLKYNDDVIPTFTHGTAVQVSQSPNVWDLTYNNRYWTDLIKGHTDLIEVLGANVPDIIDMWGLFEGCSSLESVALFDTRRLHISSRMFMGCSNLTTIPAFDFNNTTGLYQMFVNCTRLSSLPPLSCRNGYECKLAFYNCTSLTTMPTLYLPKIKHSDNMFNGCINIASGITEMYNYLSARTTLTSHPQTFRNCGSNTQTGSAELAQIPSDWK